LRVSTVNETPGPVDLEARHLEAVVRGCSDHGHQIAVLRRRHLDVGLASGTPGAGMNTTPVQSELNERLFRGHQVAQVDGIERPTHDADSARCSSHSLI
jgi:hypothetical protein